MQKIVVTGAFGHIGSALIRSLPRTFTGAEIVLIDDMSAQRYCSTFDLPEGGRYRFVESDISAVNLEKAVAGADVVVHLAAITNAAASFGREEEVERVNLVGTRLIADAAAAAGVPLIFLSTTSVYGTQSEVVDEACSPDELRPQSPYASSKLQAERYLEKKAADGLTFVILRFGTIFGHSIGMRFHTAVNKFCWQAATGQPVTVWKSALHQRRPYLDLRDAVRALEFVMRHRIYDRAVYNVLTTNTTVADILEAIRSVVPDLTVTEVDSPIMNQLSYTVANDRFQALGFRFHGDFHESIRDTLERLQGLYQARVGHGPARLVAE